MGLDVNRLCDRLTLPGNDVYRELDEAMKENHFVFKSGKALTAVISNLARRRNLRVANSVWSWMDKASIDKNTFHYNSMISCCEKVRDYNRALRLMEEMSSRVVAKNEVTFSSAISACEKCGQWRPALDLLTQMKKEGVGKTAIAYNACISACEKGFAPTKALEVFQQMKKDGVKPTVVTYSAMISAAEKGQQPKLALAILEEMKEAGHGANVIAYSAAISALAKGQMWEKALELFRELDSPSIVTYNATMTALEKSLQWERALDLFQEMKEKNMPITVVSYGSAISACEKGLQYRQCLEFLDEMTEMGIKKNVIIFGAAMATMTASCRADIAFLLIERMKLEDVAPNVHIFNSAISACARCSLWEKGYELFLQMDDAMVKRDVVTYNSVLDAVASPQPDLGRKLFKEGIEKGFYARVSRIGQEWLELDVHFLSLGGGEIALAWWFEECLGPFLEDPSKLESVKSIAIVTGYGKTRARGARMNDDGMRKRVAAMLECMGLKESPQPNKGRIHLDKQHLIEVAKRKDGKVHLDHVAYMRFKEEETTANKVPDVPQQVRPRFRPARHDEGPPGTFVRVDAALSERPSEVISDKNPPREAPAWNSEASLRRRSDGYIDNRENGGRIGDDYRRLPPGEAVRGERRGGGYRPESDYASRRDRRPSYDDLDRPGSKPPDHGDIDRRGSRAHDYDSGRRPSRGNPEPRHPERFDRDYDVGGAGSDRFRDEDRDRRPPPYMSHDHRRSSYDDSRRRGGFPERESGEEGRYMERSGRPSDRDNRIPDRSYGGGYRDDYGYGHEPTDPYRNNRGDGGGDGGDRYSNRRQMSGGSSSNFRSVRDKPDAQASYRGDRSGPPPDSRKRPYDDYNKQQPQSSRGYDVQPAFTRRRSS